MFNFKLSGDPAGGWIGEIHDGTLFQVHRPDVGMTPRDAIVSMLDTYEDALKKRNAPPPTPASPMATQPAGAPVVTPVATTA